MLKGLKIENNGVFKKNELSDNWEKLSPADIPLLEDLLKKIDGITYSKEDKKENFVFENEVNIGQGSMKSSRDENGDLVLTIRNQNVRETGYKINEDLDFEIEEQQMQTNREERKLVNYWSSNAKNIVKEKETVFKKAKASKTKQTFSSNKFDSNSTKELCEEIKKSTSNLKDGENSFEMSEEPDIFTKIANLTSSKNTTLRIIENAPADVKVIREKYLEDLKSVSPPQTVIIEPKKPAIEPLQYSFKKRVVKPTSFKKSKALQVYLRELNQIESISRFDKTNDKRRNISFVRRVSWNNKRRKHGSIIKAVEISKKMNGIRDLYARMFQLEKIVNTPLNDEEFENIISNTINSNV